MYLDDTLVFLAGATGLAGSGILEYIISNHPKTKIRAAYFRTKPFIKDERIEYVHGDLKSREDCREMVKGCDCAIMAAANTGGSQMAVSEPWKQVTDNVVMDAQMLEAFHFENVKRVVFVSTATVYQDFEGYIREDQLDLNEDPNPSHLGVGWAKRYIEKSCKFWHEKTGIEIVIARASNIFGPYAKFDPTVSNFIPAIIRKAADKLNPFEVWGEPDVTRDVIYAEDFGRAIVMMMDNDQIKFDTFNIGSGVKTTVGQVVELSLKHAEHKPSKIEYRSDKPATVKFRALDCSRAKEKLGWQPQYTIEEGIKKTTDWWIENRNWWKK